MPINLGDISFGITPDISRLQAATQAIQQFGNAVNASARAQGKGAREVEAGMRRQEAALIRAYEAARKLTTAMVNAGAPATTISTVTSRLNGYVNALKSGTLTALEFQRANERFSVGMNTSQRSLNAFVTSQKEIAAATKASERALRQEETAAIALARTLQNASIANNRLQSQIGRTATNAPRNLRQSARDLGDAPNAALNKLQSTLQMPNLTRSDQAAALREYRAEISKTQLALAEFRNEHNISGRAVSSFSKILHNSEAAFILVGGRAGELFYRFQALNTLLQEGTSKWALLGVGALGLAGALWKVGSSIIETERDLQRSERSLTAITGSSTEAKKQMKELMDVANQTGVSFTALIDPYSKWMGAVKNTTLQGADAMNVFRNMSFVIGTMGLTSQNTTSIFRALEQTLTKQAVQSQEWVLQLGNSLPGAMRVAGESMGVTEEKFREMVKNQELDGQKAIDFVKHYAQFYADSLGGVGKGVTGVVAAENLWGNSIIDLKQKINNLFGVTDTYTTALTGLTTGVRWFTENAQTLLPILAGLAGGMAVLFVGSIVAGAASLVGTVGLVVAAFVALAAAVATLLSLTDKASASEGNLADQLKQVNNASKNMSQGFVDNAHKVVNAADYATPAVDAYIESHKKLAQVTSRTELQTIGDQSGDNIAKLTKDLDEAKLAVQGHRDVIAQLSAQGVAPASGGARDLFEQEYNVKQLSNALDDALAKRKALRDYAKKPDLTLPKEPTKSTMPSTGTSGFHGKSGTIVGETEADKQAKSIRGLNEEIEKYQGLYAHMGQGQEVLDKFKVDQSEVEEMSKWTDKLRDAGVAADKAAPMLEKLRNAYHSVKQAEYDMAHTETPGQLLIGAFDKITSSIDSMVSSTLDGTFSLKELANVGKSAVSSLLSEFLKLAVMAPLKNALFGTNDKTFGLTVNGGPGIGGIVGGLFKNWFGTNAAASVNPMSNPLASASLGGIQGPMLPTAAKGMSVTPGGFRFGLGGVTSSPTMFGSRQGPILGGEAGSEGLFPLTRMGSGKLGVHANISGMQVMQPPPVEIHMHGAPEGMKTQDSTNDKGGRRLDFIFDDMIAQRAKTTGSSVQKSFAGTFGMKPATIRRGSA